ncbi:DNA repair protein RecO [Dyadobacter psychrotolerans]|uniref:DNA repair protein RecO n=1 Tax=Dyadobacter psychrotolerans TaxID=2541721 RepID=A0A4R5DK52_9BACT|nr:DNA repair protein RecO [Dyadobacter psychrotolerans]TDE13757.1 DNA repair protein RecO [Dyadobacter psychrotolerans]
MLYKTRGIALSYIRYRESSIIAKIYTELFGIQSYIINGVRSSSSKTNRIALFQPLTLLDLVVYHKGKQDNVHRISEIKCFHPFASLPYHVTKSSLALFVTEILGKTLKEEEANEPLFEFIEHSVLYLDEADKGFENFHIQFLLQLASYLGFGIENLHDLEREIKSHHFPQIADKTELDATEKLLQGGYGTLVTLDRTRRISILEKILFFYKIHIDQLGEIRSLEVLSEVLR